MQKISPFLWFNDEAEEAAQFYTSLFKNSSMGSISRNGETGSGPVGKVMIVTFTLEGQPFIALNGGPEFPFTPAISFLINTETQEETDTLWEKLSEGGEEGQCGWLKDKYGVSWQVVPSILGEMLQAPDPEKASRVMAALHQMRKIDIAALQQAYDSV